ncbi:hypothetical protein ECANGB1_826 [Enterospora canceri]|uniref:t-SNARE coiled-coil homology domain-containing protein n=1 Tax=Enterospora canceri TaxID=1081671 RepID=A0A1Y1S7F7_9MICR|nr:hypothetical protein ECANGB1_826 [Enterospora canceri]
MIQSRMTEFHEYVGLSGQKSMVEHEPRFYEELYDKIERLELLVEDSSSYRNFLVLDEKLVEMQKEVQSLDTIEIEGFEEEYEGIKYILKHKVYGIKQMINRKKIGERDEVAGERHEEYGIENETNVEGEMKKHFTQEELEQVEMENRQIVEGKEYETTRKRIKQINEVQKAINEQLIVQNERIDDVCETTKETKKTYLDLNRIQFDGAGSIFKRFLAKFILLVALFLLFKHYLNR